MQTITNDCRYIVIDTSWSALADSCKTLSLTLNWTGGRHKKKLSTCINSVTNRIVLVWMTLSTPTIYRRHETFPLSCSWYAMQNLLAWRPCSGDLSNCWSKSLSSAQAAEAAEQLLDFERLLLYLISDASHLWKGSAEFAIGFEFVAYYLRTVFVSIYGIIIP